MGRTLNPFCNLTLCTRDYPREVSLLVDGIECETLGKFVREIVEELKNNEDAEGWETFVQSPPALLQAIESLELLRSRNDIPRDVSDCLFMAIENLKSLQTCGKTGAKFA